MRQPVPIKQHRGQSRAEKHGRPGAHGYGRGGPDKDRAAQHLQNPQRTEQNV